MFTPQTAAQTAAYFVAKKSGSISILKLVKLIYLADRESMRRYGFPISYDNMVSLPHGPVPSRTLCMINGEGRAAHQQVWNRWISPRGGNIVKLNISKFKQTDLDYLSRANLTILSAVWRKFGEMTASQLRNYTHKHCAEWRDPKNLKRKSKPIKDIDIFRAVGIGESQATELADEVEFGRSLEPLLATP